MQNCDIGWLVWVGGCGCGCSLYFINTSLGYLPVILHSVSSWTTLLDLALSTLHMYRPWVREISLLGGRLSTCSEQPSSGAVKHPKSWRRRICYDRCRVVEPESQLRRVDVRAAVAIKALLERYG